MIEPSQQTCPKGEGDTHHFVPHGGHLRCRYCHLTEAKLREVPQRWRAVIAVEDVPTRDGRQLAPMSVDWSKEPIPLMRRAADGDTPDWTHPLLGYTTRISRVPAHTGTHVVAEGTLTGDADLPDNLGIGVTMTGLEVADSGHADRMLVTRAVLSQILVGGNPLWAECRLEVSSPNQD